METHNHIFILCFLLLLYVPGRRQVVHGLAHQRPVRPNKLFVFGDSYADTGNLHFQNSSWNVPYGITFPGQPAGRFSDGRVSTDYIAEYLEIKAPVPYTLWAFLKRYASTYIHSMKCLDGELKYGLNFAYGGTGVFVKRPNITTQIDYFQNVLNQSVYTERELKSSVSFVSLAGNDYSTKQGTSKSLAELESYIREVVDQLAIDLKRIHNLGVKRVAVNSLEPVGCLPEFTVSSRECNETLNSLSNLHNLYLQQTVKKLNTETNSTSNFVILDLSAAFNTATTMFKNPYGACCVGTSSEYLCGSVDGNGEEQYTVCDDPKTSFFWDYAHPTQQGWDVVFSTPAMQRSLKQLTYL